MAWDRLRSARVRVVAAVSATTVLLIGFAAGWAAPEPAAEPTVQAFLLAWESGQYAAAAALTTGAPPQVAAALEGTYRQVGAAAFTLAMAGITQNGSKAYARFDASVDLGRGGAPWNYQGSFELRRFGSSWKVVWSPAVIVPGLRPGLRLAMVATMPQRAQLLDAGGTSLAPASAVYTVGVIPARLAHPAQTASGLAGATGLPDSQVLGWITDAPTASFLELVRLSPDAYQRLRGALSDVPGLIIERQRLQLFSSIAAPVSGTVGSEAASVLQEEGIPYRPGTTVGLSGLQQAFQHMLVGTPTTEVVMQDAAGHVAAVLKQWPGHAGVDVRTTIDADVQHAANTAVGSPPGSAAIVAVSTTSGHVLAVADRQALGMPAVKPLEGRYQPGQAFTIVSTAALLGTGLDLNTPIPCGASNPIGGENFTNDPPEPDLGAQPPFRTDFADACDTAFAGLSLRLSARQLQSAASGFGLGMPWQLPVSAFAGTMQSPAGQAELAEDSIGDGSVQVSPLDMALAAAVVQSGTWHPPSLVTDPADPALTATVPFGTQVVSALQALMRATVTAGAGSAANVSGPPVYGQVGNAPLGSGGLRTAWFVGFQGTVAFAAVELTGAADVSAAPLAGQFLSDLQASS